jgi:hypothetical protein
MNYTEQNYLAGKLARWAREKLLENKKINKIFIVYNEVHEFRLWKRPAVPFRER